MSRRLPVRFWEVDVLRGVAVLMMVAYHARYLLFYYGRPGFAVFSPAWHALQVATASLFIFLVGISLALSRERAALAEAGGREFGRFLRRGLGVFALGLAITLFTLVFMRGNYVRFGILHFIGGSIILGYPFLRFGRWNLPAGGLAIALGVFFRNSAAARLCPVLLFDERHYRHTLDYFPLLPWFGVVLVGVFAGSALYRGYRRRFALPELSGLFAARLVCFLGRHALALYFLHVPVLVGILYLLGMLKVPLPGGP